MNLRDRRRQPDGPADVGTLWTMHRSGYVIRCALLAWPSDWELRIAIDGQILLAERCPRGSAAFQLGDLWRERMMRHGWQQVLPAGTANHPGHSLAAQTDAAGLDLQNGSHYSRS